MKNPIYVLRKIVPPFLVSAALTTTPSALADCLSEADCSRKGDFTRANKLSQERANKDEQSANLAAGIASLKVAQDAEIAAGDARMKAFDDEARRNFRPFSEADLADSRRNILIAGANDGRALRQTQLGMALLEGYEGFQVDVAKGIYWLHKAAAQGQVDAVKNLAETYIKGEYGIKPDYIYGFQLYKTLVRSRGMPGVEQAALLMDQAIDIFKRDEEIFYSQLAETALEANALGVPAAPQVIYKLTMVSSSSPTPIDSKFKATLETPSNNPYLIAASAYAITNGYFGIAKDKQRGKEMLQAEADAGHQPSIDILKIRGCFAAAKTPEDKNACEPLASPFYL
ncbi:MAG: hypothetical protein ABL911_09905 [Gallionella sp.]|nr:hypothetical protein [Gallionella sp.]